MKQLEDFDYAQEKKNSEGKILSATFTKPNVPVTYSQAWDKNETAKREGKTQRAYYLVEGIEKMLNLSQIMVMCWEDASLKASGLWENGQFVNDPANTLLISFEKGHIKSIKLAGDAQLPATLTAQDWAGKDEATKSKYSWDPTNSNYKLN